MKCCAINQGSIEKSILVLAQQGRRKRERFISRDEFARLIGCVISALSLGVMRTKVITCEGGKSGCIRSWTVCWCVHLSGNAAANKLSLQSSSAWTSIDKRSTFLCVPCSSRTQPADINYVGSSSCVPICSFSFSFILSRLFLSSVLFTVLSFNSVPLFQSPGFPFVFLSFILVQVWWLAQATTHRSSLLFSFCLIADDVVIWRWNGKDWDLPKSIPF